MFKSLVLVAILSVTLGNALPSHQKHKIPLKRGLQIVGGKDADIADYPFQVALNGWYGLYCGGFLISENWVITAGHCVDLAPYDDVFARIGSNYSETGGEYIKIEKSILHPKYDGYTIDYDIGLLQLSQSVSIAIASPAQLPAAEDNLEEGTLVTITGWGATFEGGDIAVQLQAVSVPVVNQQNCSDDYKDMNVITENMFCAGDEQNGGKDACQGDSGGPVSVDGVVVGIVSWGQGCAEPGYPGVYTRVANFRDWIKENTGI